VGTRCNQLDEAARRAVRQLAELTADLRAARLAAGLSQRAVARALGCSRQLVTAWESHELEPTPTQLARWGAVLGFDVPFRTYPSGSPLRDAGQLRLLARFRATIGDAWNWRTEVPVTANALERRAFDAVLDRHPLRVGCEAIVHLTDAQAQIRSAILKQEAAQLDRMVLVLADTRNNRAALVDGAPTLLPAFPLASRTVLRELRAGRLPASNGIAVV
jgi:transcriptional regulator with XRE-family HTH domain